MSEMLRAYLLYCTVCIRLVLNFQANLQLLLVTSKLKKWMRKRHRRAKTMSSVWDSYPDIMLTLITVNMWGIRLCYKPLSDLFCRLTKAINSSFSFTGYCACCSVVAVICVCLLVYWDYAATSTGVGNQQWWNSQTNTVFSYGRALSS